MKNLIVGSGITGATLARRIAEDLNEEVLVIEKRDHIGGSIYDYRDQNGIMIHKYGSHIFHTNSDRVWQFLNRFTSFNTYMHKVLAFIDGVETPIPFNLRSLYDVFPNSLASRLETKLLAKFAYNTKIPILEFLKQDDPDLNFLADYVYQKVFLNYTAKQWGQDPAQIDKAVTARVPVYISRDCRYFQDKYQGIPLGGYTKMLENMLFYPNIKLRLNTDFADVPDHYDRIFYTGSIDEFFGYKFGVLPYRSVNFKFEEHDKEYYQKNAVINYPNNYDFTRIHEYKYYLDDKTPKTVIAKEYSEAFSLGKNDRYYPIANLENQNLYEKYLAEAQKIPNLYFLGRLGDYKYYNMDAAVDRALKLSI